MFGSFPIKVIPQKTLPEIPNPSRFVGEDPLSLRASGTKPKVSKPRGSSPTGSPHFHAVLQRIVCQDHSTAMKPLKSHSCGHGNKEDAK